jgi:hypothetical protein
MRSYFGPLDLFDFEIREDTIEAESFSFGIGNLKFFLPWLEELMFVPILIEFSGRFNEVTL